MIFFNAYNMFLTMFIINNMSIVSITDIDLKTHDTIFESLNTHLSQGTHNNTIFLSATNLNRKDGIPQNRVKCCKKANFILNPF